MALANSNSAGALAADLFVFVTALQKPRINDQEWSGSVRAQCIELGSRVDEFKDSVTTTKEKLIQSLDEMSAKLSSTAKEFESHPSLANVRGRYQQLSVAYEDLIVQIKKSREASQRELNTLTHIKPINYSRNLFHLMMGLTCFAVYEIWVTRLEGLAILGTLLLAATFTEIFRQVNPNFNNWVMNLFSAVSRPHERHRVNSATWYLLAVFLLTLIFPKTAALIGFITLAVGDPAATIIGKKFGRTKIWKERSLEGSSAFFTVTFAACFTYVWFLQTEWSLFAQLGISATVAFAAALTELFSEKLDDNLSVPLAAACIVSIWLLFL